MADYVTRLVCPVETSVVVEDGQRKVLLQLPYGYVVMTPASAREVASALVERAEMAEVP